MAQPSASGLAPVWDLPLRLFHWALVVSVLVALVTAQIGGDAMRWHGWAGQAVLVLLAFRLAWGFVGGHHARFVNFLPTLSRWRAYRASREHPAGHSPLGALSVFFALALLLVQGVLGLVANDEVVLQGPWAQRIPEELSLLLTAWHRRMGNVVWAWVGLHLLAMVFYASVLKRPLWRRMLSGGTDRSGRAGGATILRLGFAVAVAFGGYGVIRTGEPVAATSPSQAPAVAEPAW